jgi:excinuclease ABC subunit C
MDGVQNMKTPKDELKEKVRKLPETPGVYLMKDALGRILYVGKAKNLKRRVSSYFQPSRKQTYQQPKVNAMISLIRDFDTISVRSDAEALLLESKLIKEHRPRHNTMLTDDKRFLMIRVDIHNPIPKFQLVRTRKDNKSRYYGPFPYTKLVRTTYRELQTKFGILLNNATPSGVREDGTFQLYQDARAEIYGHPNEITPDEYKERVNLACQFLEGKSKEWLKELEQEMLQASQNLQYEKAAELRDLAKALRETISPNRKFKHDLRTDRDNSIPLKVLQETLGLPSPPAKIECFDISHISGSFCVASMVHFLSGAPDKSQYRRFKIKTFIGNDDFRAMHEVVTRRYVRLHNENKPLPDLILIDGGKGQVNAALAALESNLIPCIPPIVGLAKKEETLVFPGENEDLHLSRKNPALRLLQRVRDESHRFANNFNAELRSMAIRNSFLEEIPGIGPSRKKILLQHFRDLADLKKAKPEELQKIPGIGPKFATTLATHLRNL